MQAFYPKVEPLNLSNAGRYKIRKITEISDMQNKVKNWIKSNLINSEKLYPAFYVDSLSNTIFDTLFGNVNIWGSLSVKVFFETYKDQVFDTEYNDIWNAIFAKLYKFLKFQSEIAVFLQKIRNTCLEIFDKILEMYSDLNGSVELEYILQIENTLISKRKEFMKKANQIDHILHSANELSLHCHNFLMSQNEIMTRLRKSIIFAVDLIKMTTSALNSTDFIEQKMHQELKNLKSERANSTQSYRRCNSADIMARAGRSASANRLQMNQQVDKERTTIFTQNHNCPFIPSSEMFSSQKKNFEKRFSVFDKEKEIRAKLTLENKNLDKIKTLRRQHWSRNSELLDTENKIYKMYDLCTRGHNSPMQYRVIFLK